MKNKIPESQIQKAILDWLHYKKILAFKHRNVGIMKPNGSYIPLASGEKGISDIIGCLPDGRFLAIEVKAKGKKPSTEQANFLERVNKNNGVGILAYGIEDVEEILK